MLSAASAWEIATKAQVGKLALPSTPGEFLPEDMAIATVEGLAVLARHALHVCSLPDHHRDPFDRTLVAQNQLENLPIMTRGPNSP